MRRIIWFIFYLTMYCTTSQALLTREKVYYYIITTCNRILRPVAQSLLLQIALVATRLLMVVRVYYDWMTCNNIVSY